MKNHKRYMKIASRLAAMAIAFVAFATPSLEAFAATDIDIDAAKYGYGKYVVTARGTASDGVYDEDQVVFYYLPAHGEISEDTQTGKYYLDVKYDAHDDDAPDANVAKIDVKIYDADGNLVAEMPTLEILPPNTRIELPFAEYGLPSGKYVVAIESYGKDGNLLFTPYKLEFNYEKISVPDTGRFFAELNITRADYLATGLIIFFLAVAAGTATIVRRNRIKTGKTGRKK